MGRNAEIELGVLEIVKKRIIPIFGPRLQRQAKLLHEGCSIKLNVHNDRAQVRQSLRDILTAEQRWQAQGENLL